MGDEHLSTFSAEEIVPILRESEDTSKSDSKNILPSYGDFSSINIPCNDFVTFSNPLFIFDVNFNSSDINPLFDKVLENIECKDSYDSNLDESTFLVIPLSNSNKDECDNDEIDAFLAIEVPMCIEEGYYDSERDVIYLESLLSDDTTHNLSSEFRCYAEIHIPDDSIPLGIESDFDSEEDIIDNLLNDYPIHECLSFDMEPNVLMISNINEDEFFDQGGVEINVKVDDSFTFVTPTFLPLVIYLAVSSLLSSTKNEDTIFDPGISTGGISPGWNFNMLK
ncbi:hypothetical protein Tco_1573794 [Tanacetum coccineum]